LEKKGGTTKEEGEQHHGNIAVNIHYFSDSFIIHQVKTKKILTVTVSLRSLAVFKRGNRDNKPQSREEPGRETTEKPPARMAGIFC